jgi:opacity protein-like surface antigen
MRVMRAKTVFVLVVSFLASLPYAASAQPNPVNFSFGGGYTQPNAEVSDRLGGGYNFNIGLQGNVTPVIGIEGLYSFNGFGDKDLPPLDVAVNPPGATVPADLSGDMSMQYGTASLIVQKPDGTVRPYGLVGMGVYYRKVRLTSPGVGWVPGYCDPWWYVCYPGGWVETTNILGDRSSTDFGMSFGGGVNFGVAYAELRYHYVWGPEVEPRSFTGPGGGNVAFDGRKANGQFLQTTFGLRF